MVKEIKLTRGHAAIVDDHWYEYLNQWKWYARSGEDKNKPYAARCEYNPNGKNKLIHMHRVINKTPDGMDTDHINRQRLDNREENLRSCTHSENIKNTKTRSGVSSSYRGVSWHKVWNKWQAMLKVNNKQIWLGDFQNEDDAAVAYNMAALRYHREFATLNMIPKLVCTDR